MKRKWLTASIFGILAQFFGTPTAFAQLNSFTVLAGTTVTNTGSSVVNGGLGVSPGSAVTGFPPGTVVSGTIHSADAVAAQGQVELTTLYNTLAAQPCGVNLTGQDLGGLTLTPGVYCFNNAAQLTGILTLNGLGNPNATFTFNIASTLTTASASSVLLTNGAGSCGVAWRVGSSATLGTGTAFFGNIIALTSITLNTGASISGRVLARNGAVTLDTNGANFCSGSASLPGLPPPIQLGAPALSLTALGGLALLLAAMGSVLAVKARAW